MPSFAQFYIFALNVSLSKSAEWESWRHRVGATALVWPGLVTLCRAVKVKFDKKWEKKERERESFLFCKMANISSHLDWHSRYRGWWGYEDIEYLSPAPPSPLPTPPTVSGGELGDILMSPPSLFISILLTLQQAARMAGAVRIEKCALVFY